MKSIIKRTVIYILIVTLWIGNVSMPVMANVSIDGDVTKNPWAELFQNKDSGSGNAILNEGNKTIKKSHIKKAIKTSIISANKKTKKSKKVKIVLKKIKAVKGVRYQIKYASNKKMKRAKIKTFKSNRITLKKLHSKKKYYIMARTFVKASNGKKVYSNWTKKKNIKIKKR